MVDHEEKASNLAEALGAECSGYRGAVSISDVLAAASDRIPTLKFDKHAGVIEWSSYDSAFLLHPLAGELAGNLISESSNVLMLDDIPVLRKENLNLVLRDVASYREEIQNNIREKLRNVKERLDNDPRKKFLWLWRNLDSLHDEKGFRSFILSWLPAETRLPDHSIYDHLITSSAFTVPYPTLVNVDIGGVQAFIEHSRKVRDLWASSYLVSMLSLAAMMVVVEELGPDSIIYPDLRKVPLIDIYLFLENVLTEEDLSRLFNKEEFIRSLIVPSIPGSFIFIAPYDKVDELLHRIEDKVRNFFPLLWNQLSKHLKLDLKLRFEVPPPLSLRHYKVHILEIESISKEFMKLGSDRESIKKKLRELIPDEISESIRIDGRDLLDHATELIVLRNEYGGYQLQGTLLYLVAYLVLRTGMFSQKLTSNFFYSEEPCVERTVPIRRRCRLCGLRNPIIPGDRISWADFVRNLRDDSETRWAGWLLEPDEPLCPVCLMKRLLRSFSKDGFSPLITVWSIVLNKGEEEIREALKKIFRDDLRKVVGEIPTLDDIAVTPLKKLVKERIKKGDISKEWDNLISRMISGVEAAIEIYKKSKDKDERSDIRRYSSIIISEISRSWEELLERFDESAEVLKDFIDDNLRKCFSDPMNVPGTYFFISTWKNLLESIKVGFEEEKETLMDLLDTLDRFYKKLEVEPSNYVAYILSDADRMGDWISGKMFFEKRMTLKSRIHPKLRKSMEPEDWVIRFVTPSLHRTISRIVRTLAQEVYPHIISSLDGFVFYSGGDDLLAVVPACNALKLVETLHSCYSSEIIKLPDGRVFMSMGRLATLSSGLVIAHRLLPMSEILEKVREEEEVAKGEKGEPNGRDRCSMVRLTRGLSETRAILPGLLLRVSEGLGVGELIEKIFDYIRKKKLSKSFLRDLLYYLELYSTAYSSPEENKDFLLGLISRAIERNLHVDETEKKRVKEEILDIYRKISEIQAKTEKFSDHPIVNFHRALLIMSEEVI